MAGGRAEGSCRGTLWSCAGLSCDIVTRVSEVILEGVVGEVTEVLRTPLTGSETVLDTFLSVLWFSRLTC